MKILVATDGSEYSIKTIDCAIKMTASLNAETTVLYVIEDILPSMEGQIPLDILEKLNVKAAETAVNVLEKAAERFRKKGMEVKTLSKKGLPANIISEIAEDEKFDLVIIGSSGLGGAKALILGSVSNKIAQSIKVNVLIVK